MDAKPKSNKQKRLEKKRKRELAAVAGVRETARAAEAARIARAERVLRDTKLVRRDLPRFLERLTAGEPANLPVHSDLDYLARLFATINKQQPNHYPLMPDADAFRRLVEVCWERTDLLRGRDAVRLAHALLALSAYVAAWVRKPGTWTPRSHNAGRQFHSLVCHIVALYDMPAFLDSAWMEGLTALGVVHQRWFIHVAQGRSLRTADELPISLTRKQAHLYLTAPADFDVLSAFRWAQVLDLGGDDRLARSIAGTRIGKSFDHDDFWVTVMRWLVDQPMLDPVHHAPIIDYLNHQRFEALAPNPLAGLPGQPALLPPQPNLTMKGRDPAGLLHSVEQWHRRLGRMVHGPAAYWRPTGMAPFRLEEGEGKARRVFTITELVSSYELYAEGQAMGHCVASYAPSCVRGMVSIWSLRLTEASGQETRLLTLEVGNSEQMIVQARRRFNAMPSPRELAILRRWALAGGPSLSGWVAR